VATLVLAVANQHFSMVTAQRVILLADARKGGLSKFNYVILLLSDCK